MQQDDSQELRPPAGHDRRPRIAFVCEYVLGHRTWFDHLMSVAEQRIDVEPVAIRLSGEPGSWAEAAFRRSWSAQLSLAARRGLLAAAGLEAAVIHTQTAALAARGLMRTLPTVISSDATPRNFDSVGSAYGHARQSEVIESVKRTIVRRPLERARHVITWSEWAGRSFVEDYGVDAARVTAINPGVPVPAVPYQRTDASGPLRVLFVGGAFRRKGGALLLDALDQLEGDWELDVVTKDDVPPHRGVRVHHGLNASTGDLDDLYRRADLFVLPTLSDTFSMVCLEAMAAALPVVVTEVGGISEIVEPDRSGLTVPPGDVHGLRDALQSLMDDPSRRAAMGQRGWEIARSRFQRSANANRFLDVVLDATATGDSSRAGELTSNRRARQLGRRSPGTTPSRRSSSSSISTSAPSSNLRAK